jgi:subtilisin family serine protease
MNMPAGPLTRALGFRASGPAGHDLEPVTVAVLDTGIDGSHPDLAGRMVRAFACVGGEGQGVELRQGASDANNDLYGHGTAVASIIARIAPNARFIDVRVLGGDRLGSGEALLAGLDHALGGEAQLINMSLAAGGKFVPLLAPLCDRAYRLGKPIVAARRNMPLVDEGYPAALIPCIGVDNHGAGPEHRWGYRTETIEFSACGEDIVTAAAGGGYTTMSGSSFATPIIAGHVCLLMGAVPGLRPFEIKALLKEMATPAQGGPGAKD